MNSGANELQTSMLHERFAWPQKVSHALSVLVMNLKREFQSKRVVFTTVCACALKSNNKKEQATPTRDGSKLFHNVSTNVSSVTRVCTKMVRVCQCVYSCGFF